MNEETINNIFDTIRIIVYFGEFPNYKKEVSEYFNISEEDYLYMMENQKIIVNGEDIFKKLNNDQTKVRIDSLARLRVNVGCC